MKKAMLPALFVVFAASWCLAQTDSLPAPAAEPCQPGACAMNCQPAVSAEPFAPKWAVGIIFGTLEKDNFNGTVFIERKKNWFYYGLGLKYEYRSYDFIGNYGYYADSFYTERTTDYSNGSITLLPTVSIAESYRPWQASVGFQLALTYGLINDYEKATTVGPYETYIYVSDERTDEYAICLQVPFTIERLISIRDKQFTIGLEYVLTHGGIEWRKSNDENTWVGSSWTDSYNHTNKYSQWLWDLDLFAEPSIRIKYRF
jgi:hypothetical protein